MWLICLHVVVCVCLYGLYRDDMSQGSTEYWVASSAVHPSKTLDFGHLERSHMAASASWAGRNDDDHYMSWSFKLHLWSKYIAEYCRYVPDSTLRHIETYWDYSCLDFRFKPCWSGFPWFSCQENCWWASASSFWSHDWVCSSLATRCSKTSWDAASVPIQVWLLNHDCYYLFFYTSILDHVAGWKFRKSAMARFRSKGPTCSDLQWHRRVVSCSHRSMWCQGTSKVGLPGVSCQRLDGVREHHSV